MRLFSSILSLLLLLLTNIPLAQAGEALLNSEVSVDVTGKDSADARAQALAKAEIDALTDLLIKFSTPEQAREILSSSDAKRISSMVRGTEVLEEKITSNRYRARLRISFDGNEISTLVGKADEESGQGAPSLVSSFLIIPAYDENGVAMLWEDGNPWRYAWRKTGLEMNTGDIIVPYGDNTDSMIVDLKSLPALTYSALAPLVTRYGISDIVILQAKFVPAPDMSLTVTKRRLNRTRNEVTMTTYRADPQETRDLLLMRAAHDIADNLQHKKDEELINSKTVRGGERNKVMILASVTTLASWTQLREKINGLPMLDKLEILAMSPQQVDMLLYYRGTPESLASAITAKELRLIQNKDYWVISRD